MNWAQSPTSRQYGREWPRRDASSVITDRGAASHWLVNSGNILITLQSPATWPTSFIESQTFASNLKNQSPTVTGTPVHLKLFVIPLLIPRCLQNFVNCVKNGAVPRLAGPPDDFRKLFV